MPQSPFQVDQLQIEPGSGDTIVINRDVSGNLTFTDTHLPTGIALQQLLGLQNLKDVYVVGKENTPYTSVQDALNAIPDASSDTSVVLVTNGTYTENISITKDNVILQGIGGVLVNDGNSSTVTVEVSTTSTPNKLQIKDLDIRCTQDGKSCVSVLGANQFASGTVTVSGFPVAGDSFTVNGVTLLGVEGNRTSGLNNFSVNGVSTDNIAIEITEALMDENNGFVSFVTSEVVGSIVTLTSVLPGSIGNTYTLTTASGNFTLSGPTLVGGSSAGTSLGSEEISISNVNLFSTGVGGYFVYADTMNNLTLNNVSGNGSALTASMLVSNVASLKLYNVKDFTDVSLNYDNGLDQPSILTSLYELSNVQCGNVAVNLTGVGSTVISNSVLSNLTVSGDRTVKLYNSKRDGGSYIDTPTVEENTVLLQTIFTASNNEVVSLPFPQSDTNYVVLVESPDLTVKFSVISKTVNSFTIVSDSLYTGTINSIVKRF